MNRKFTLQSVHSLLHVIVLLACLAGVVVSFWDAGTDTRANTLRFPGKVMAQAGGE